MTLAAELSFARQRLDAVGMVANIHGNILETVAFRIHDRVSNNLGV